MLLPVDPPPPTPTPPPGPATHFEVIAHRCVSLTSPVPSRSAHRTNSITPQRITGHGTFTSTSGASCRRMAVNQRDRTTGKVSRWWWPRQLQYKPPTLPSPTSNIIQVVLWIRHQRPGTPFGKNFDGVVPPALPPGWGSATWVASSVVDPDTPPNDAFVDDPAFISDKLLGASEPHR